MVYRALAEYLKHQIPPPRVSPLAISIPIAVFLASLIWETTRQLACLTSALTIVAMIYIATAMKQRRRRWLAYKGTLESDDWMNTLADFAERRQLEERSHPQMLADLEACAQLRRGILDMVDSREWNALVRNSEWKRVQQLCIDSAESLFREALWASKGGFRPFGARRETFKKRCEDPNFARASLEGVRLARAQLERLLEDVSDDPFASRTSQDALARAQAELKAIRDAEEEVRALQ